MRCRFRRRHGRSDGSDTARSGVVFIPRSNGALRCLTGRVLLPRERLCRNFRSRAEDQPVYFSPASATSTPTTISRIAFLGARLDFLVVRQASGCSTGFWSFDSRAASPILMIPRKKGSSVSWFHQCHGRRRNYRCRLTTTSLSGSGMWRSLSSADLADKWDCERTAAVSRAHRAVVSTVRPSENDLGR